MMEKSMAKCSIKLDQIVSLISKLPSPPRLAERSDTIWPAHKFLEPYNRTAKEFLFSLRDGLVTMEYPPWLASRHDTSPKPVIRK